MNIEPADSAGMWNMLKEYFSISRLIENPGNHISLFAPPQIFTIMIKSTADSRKKPDQAPGWR